jgi:hypothetical protein
VRTNWRLEGYDLIFTNVIDYNADVLLRHREVINRTKTLVLSDIDTNKKLSLNVFSPSKIRLINCDCDVLSGECFPMVEEVEIHNSWNVFNDRTLTDVFPNIRHISLMDSTKIEDVLHKFITPRLNMVYTNTHGVIHYYYDIPQRYVSFNRNYEIFRIPLEDVSTDNIKLLKFDNKWDFNREFLINLMKFFNDLMKVKKFVGNPWYKNSEYYSYWKTIEQLSLMLNNYKGEINDSVVSLVFEMLFEITHQCEEL